MTSSMGKSELAAPAFDSRCRATDFLPTRVGPRSGTRQPSDGCFVLRRNSTEDKASRRASCRTSYDNAGTAWVVMVYSKISICGGLSRRRTGIRGVGWFTEAFAEVG